MSLPPQSYVSALLAKASCHDDGVLDSVLQKLSLSLSLCLSVLRCISVVFFADDESGHSERLQLLQENSEPNADQQRTGEHTTPLSSLLGGEEAVI